MNLNYYTYDQIIPLIISALFIILSLITYHIDKKRIGLVLLFIGSLGLGYFIANLDHFLIIWDEQYHALVAKNMMNNPFKPTLYSIPLLEYDYKNWTGNHIWVHKQPLFLWQMALSLKIVGINEMAIRIPSIIMHSFATLMIYRIGKISNSANVGYYGALFFTVAYFPLEMIAGKFATDHNDLIFLCYVTASFWAWFEYSHSQKKYWLIVIGVFAGCAVLVKWLPGLLVFATWFISLGIEDKKNWLNIKAYFPLLISGVISLLVFIPWQIYLFFRFPMETQNEYLHNLRHFNEPLDGHGGSMWFHLNAIKDIYGSGTLVPVLLVLGLFFLVKKSTRTIFKVTILSSIIITYVFYSFAETKMIAFCLIVSPFFFLGLGSLTDSAILFIKSKIQFKKVELYFRIIVLIVICIFLFNFKKITNYHTNWKPNDNCNRIADLKEMAFINKLKTQLGNDNYVVFNANVRLNGHIPVMFYTDYISYDFIPNEIQLNRIKKQLYKIAILDNGNLPDFLQGDKDVIKIKL
jgi:4-amino-4-deoxy-L-arabinose transferase